MTNNDLIVINVGSTRHVLSPPVENLGNRLSLSLGEGMLAVELEVDSSLSL